MASLSTCPWWCEDHRAGETVEDEQHARLFDAPEGASVAIVRGVLPSDVAELAYAAESYEGSGDGARAFARALVEAVEVFNRIDRGGAR